MQKATLLAISQFGPRILAGMLCLGAFLGFFVLTPNTEANSKPNIIFILSDDQTLQSISKMPYLSSRTDWITFTNAFENVALCCTSRSTILTGQYDTHTGVLSNAGKNDGRKLNDKETIAVWLQKEGYTTGLVGKYLNNYPWSRGSKYVPPGWDEWQVFSGDEALYYNYKLNENGSVKSYGSKPSDYSTDVLAKKAVSFVQKAQTPFFLYFSPKTPHNPYTPAPRHKGVYENEPVELPSNFSEADVSDKPKFIRTLPNVSAAKETSHMRREWELLLALDEAIEDLDQVLAERGLLENTVVIFMTDNGYAHGEHRWEEKKCQYDVCLRTPLLIRYPGHSAKEVHELVQNIDIASTIAELAGATPGISQDGASLVPLLEGTATTWRSEILNHWGGGGKVELSNPPNFWSVRTINYRYTELVTGEKELYDYTVDPYELSNKAGNASYTSIEADLKSRLNTLKTQAQ